MLPVVENVLVFGANGKQIVERGRTQINYE
jgi:hypothetical protein